MGIYTQYDLPQVDAVIEAHMQTLRDICLSRLGANLASLVLSGSFGRGEGSVLLHSDGSIEPLRDYDTRVILNQPVPSAVIETIRSEFMRTTRLGCTGEKFSGEGGFTLTVEALTVRQLQTVFVRDHDLRVYDHVCASHLIYGEDCSSSLQFPRSRIPLVNGLRLLFQKMIGLVGHFPAQSTAPAELRRTLIYECDKTFVEICTALVLLAGDYVPSYRQRAELFNENWQTWFPDLAIKMPRLAEQISQATRAKLYPTLSLEQSPSDAFEQAREALLAVCQYYVLRLFGAQITPGTAGCNHMRRILRREYYRAAVSNWQSQHGLNGRLLHFGLNAAYQYRLRFEFARISMHPGVFALWQTIRTPDAPILAVYLAAWCILAAGYSSPDPVLLEEASAALRRLPGDYQGSQTSGQVSYLTAREMLIDAYSLGGLNG